MHAADRGGVDDGTAVLTHPGLDRERRPQQRRPQVDLKNLGEPSVILLDQRAVCRVGAGVVDQDVDAAEAVKCQVDAAFGSILLDGVGGHADRAAADLFGRGVGAFLLTGGEHHVRAVGGQSLRNGQPDTPRGAGDDRGSAGQVLVVRVLGGHSVSLCRLRW